MNGISLPIAVLLFAFLAEAGAPPPAALIARAGDGAAYLEWNPGSQVRPAGYHVYRRLAGEERFRRVSDAPLARPEYTDSPLLNGYRYEFTVTTVLEGGGESARSNLAEVRPRPSRAPIVRTGPAVIEVPGFEPVRVERALQVTFQYGHSIVLDTEAGRVRAWQAEDGTHLLYPLTQGASIEVLRPGAPLPLRGRYAGHTFRDNAISFNWRLGDGEERLEETWSPLSRRIGTAEYRGLERRIEIGLSALHRGACVLRLNDGFSPGGAADDAVTGDVNAPFLFAALPRGTLIIAPRLYRHASTLSWSSRGNGEVRALRPNLEIELAECGPRVLVESFEYLWSPGAHPEPRKHFVDAATWYRRRLAELYPRQPPEGMVRDSPSNR